MTGTLRIVASLDSRLERVQRPESQFNLLCAKAALLARARRCREAEPLLHRLELMLLEPELHAHRSEYLYAKAMVLHFSGRVTEGLQHALQARSTAQSGGQLQTYARCEAQVALFRVRGGDFEGGVRTGLRALTTCARFDDYQSRAQTELALGTVATTVGAWSLAETLLHRACDHAALIEDDIASVWAENERLRLAMESLRAREPEGPTRAEYAELALQAEATLERIRSLDDDYALHPVTKSILASIYRRAGRYHEAEHLLLDCLPTMERVEPLRPLTQARINLALLWARCGHAGAAKLIDLCLQTVEGSSDVMLRREVHHTAAMVLARLGDGARSAEQILLARTYLEQATELADELRQQLEDSLSLYTLGLVRRVQDRAEKGRAEKTEIAEDIEGDTTVAA